MFDHSHTPGPWKWQTVSPVGGDTDLFFIGRGAMDKTEGNELVAEVLSPYPWADAELLAAAPELLEACEDARQWISDGDHRNGGKIVLCTLLAAIAKATK